MTNQTEPTCNGDSADERLEWLEGAHEVARAALMTVGPPAIRALTEMLSHRHWSHRAAAASFSSTFGPSAEPAVPALLQMLQDGDPRVRRVAGYSLEYF